MHRQCCECECFYGEKPPFDDESITHGYCEKCFERNMKILSQKHHHKKAKNYKEEITKKEAK